MIKIINPKEYSRSRTSSAGVVLCNDKESRKKTIEDYARVEKKIYGKKEYDAVLVGADTTKDLKKAYPNYFLDTKEFINHLNKILDKYPKNK